MKGNRQGHVLRQGHGYGYGYGHRQGHGLGHRQGHGQGERRGTVNKIITIPMSHKNTANYCTKMYCGNLPTAEIFLHTEHRLKSTKYFYIKIFFAACQSGKTFAARQLRQKVLFYYFPYR